MINIILCDVIVSVWEFKNDLVVIVSVGGGYLVVIIDCNCFVFYCVFVVLYE